MVSCIDFDFHPDLVCVDSLASEAAVAKLDSSIVPPFDQEMQHHYVLMLATVRVLF